MSRDYLRNDDCLVDKRVVYKYIQEDSEKR